jgi:hypothetical protein
MPHPPPGSPSFYVTLHLIDGSNYETLQNQYSGRDINYTFMAMTMLTLGGGYQNYVSVATDGEFPTGPLTGIGFDSRILSVGWIQDSITLETRFADKDASLNPVGVSSGFTNFYTSSDRTVGNTDNSQLMFFKDDDGNTWPWYFEDRSSFSLDRWYVQSYAAGLSTHYQLYQTEPYNAINGNYGDAWSGSNPPTSEPFPSASTSMRDCYFSSNQILNPPVQDWLRLNYNVTKTFAKIGQQYFDPGFFVPIPTGKVSITDGSQRFVNLDFGQIAPFESTTKK